MISTEDAKKLVADVLADVGRLSLTGLPELVGSPVAKILRLETVVYKYGPEPYDGGKWKHASSAYKVSHDDVQDRPADEVVSLVVARRREALVKALRQVEKRWRESPTPARPNEFWRLAILAGAWLRETVVPMTIDRDVVVWVDCTFAFAHKDSPGLYSDLAGVA